MSKQEEMDQYQSITNATVLIVDDNESMRDLLRAAIEQWGYQIIEAANGEEAWKIMQQPVPPQILILDWLMPKLDGLTLCNKIRTELATYPYIIFLTQVSGVTNILKGFEAGADEFLLKPVNFTELRIRILAGERIIKYLDIIADQKKELKKCQAYAKSLELKLAMPGAKSSG